MSFIPEGDPSQHFPTGADGTCWSGGSRFDNAGARGPETNTHDMMVDSAFTQEVPREEMAVVAIGGGVGVGRTGLAGYESFTELLGQWEDGMFACRHLLDNIPRVQCLHPPQDLYSTGWRAVDGRLTAAVETEPLDLSFLSRRQGRQTGRFFSRAQTTTTGLAHETLCTVTNYLAVMTPTLAHAGSRYDIPGPWGTHGHRTAGDAETQGVRYLLGGVDRPDEESFEPRRQVAAAEATESESAPPARRRRSNNTMAQRPGTEATSPAWSPPSTEPPFMRPSLSEESTSFAAAASRASFKGQRMADPVDDSPDARTYPSRSSSTSSTETSSEDDDLAAEHRRHSAAESQVPHADYQRLLKKYDDEIHQHALVKKRLDDVLEEHGELRKRCDRERGVHNRVMETYVNRTSGVRWNEGRSSSSRGARGGSPSPPVSPRTVRPARESVGRRPSSTVSEGSWQSWRRERKRQLRKRRTNESSAGSK